MAEASAILMLTSTSEQLTPPGIVDGVGVAGAAEQAELDASALGDAEIGALADDLRPDLGGGDADRVVGAVADLLVGLGGGAHIGADAAEPQKIDRRLEDGLHDLDRRGDRLRQADALPQRRQAA